MIGAYGEQAGNDPLSLFRQWMSRAEREGQTAPEVCCLSTIGLDGYPNARIVALKECDATGFVVTGPNGSRKALELERIARAALVFWWAAIGAQVRVQGDTSALDGESADEYFAARPRDAQVTAWVSRQGEPLLEAGTLAWRVEFMRTQFSSEPVPRPDAWGGYRIVPRRIEFFRFREDRWHDRLEFYKDGDVWRRHRLQP